MDGMAKEEEMTREEEIGMWCEEFPTLTRQEVEEVMDVMDEIYPENNEKE